MASGLLSVVVFALCAVLAPCVSAGDRDCLAFNNNPYQRCEKNSFCCGSCLMRYCCQDNSYRFSEDQQEDCAYTPGSYMSGLPMAIGVAGSIVSLIIFISCCVCPCCCLYKMCRRRRPVMTTTTHTTVVTTAPQQYPQQPTATPGQPQSYQGGQYQPYQSTPVQPGYGAQPMPQGYGAQPMPQGYGAQHMPTSPYHGQPFMAAPPPTYQEAIGPGFHPNPMPYSQAAFTPGQPAYPLQPPVQPQPNAPPPPTGYLAQPAYNPDYIAPPP
ncbi:protein shisa-5 [Etheostoma spectabile]|uniref:protein shisa-5 n=1 Tax=Etheostoma spectabile TaxID=54343 RepID=UPI0013AFC800|nr:protein shisa-5-like [Etheostoma spectabile]